MIPSDWMPHRRDDGETVGYIEMVGQDFLPHDLLGRPLGDLGDWEAAEARLDDERLGWLADRHVAMVGGEERTVAITEVTPAHVRLVDDEYGSASVVGAPRRESWTIDLPLANGASLRRLPR